MNDLHCHVSVAETQPLRVRFALENPATASGPILVPRSLRPLGAFVKLQIVRSGAGIAFATTLPKFAPKLDPAERESYVELDPGYGYSVLFDVENAPLPPGQYRLDVSYTNLQYRGPQGRLVGEQLCSTSVDFRVD